MKVVHDRRTEDVRLLDDLITQAQSEADEWAGRLDAMRGQYTVQDAHKRAEAVGFERLLEQLDAIAYPAVSLIAWHRDPSKRWVDSEAEIRVNTLYKKHQRGRALVCVRSLESLQRAKATTQFWQLAGIHPSDAENDPDGFSLEQAWWFFTHWQTYAALAQRSAGHKESRRFASLANAHRFLTAQFLEAAPKKENVERARPALSQLIDSIENDVGHGDRR